MTFPGKHLTRRQYLQMAGMVGASAVLAACSTPAAPVAAPTNPPPPAAPKPTTVPPTAVPVPVEKPSATAAAAPAQPTLAQPKPTSVPTSAPVTAPTEAAKPVASAGGAYLSVVRGGAPEAMVRAALASIGGIARFVKPGHNVIIKPNICVDNYEESQAYKYAATTNPEVVAALVKMCLESGAKTVRVMDNPFGGPASSTYQKSGIKRAVEAAGGTMELMNKVKFKKTPIPNGKDIKEWTVYGEIMDADVFINVPIAKHHSGAGLTLSAKNLMGTTDSMNNIHINLHQRIADLASVVRPEITVMDAVRILTNHGPGGGNLNDVKQINTILASVDLVAIDTYATSFFGKKPTDIQYIKYSADAGLGTMDLKSIKIEEITLT